MSLTERHRWCAGKILETFGPELTSEAVQQFIRVESVLQKFTQFFRGEGSGRIFISYQPPVVEGVVSRIIRCVYVIFHRYFTFSVHIFI